MGMVGRAMLGAGFVTAFAMVQANPPEISEQVAELQANAMSSNDESVDPSSRCWLSSL